MIAVIAARAGSQRLPKKNKKLLNQLPLFEHTLHAAYQSGCFQKIIFTTDDQDILDALKDDPRCTIHHRPPHLADGQSTMMQVLDDLGTSEQWDDKTDICLLAPVNPLRSSIIIRQCFNQYQDQQLHALATVNRARLPGQFLVNLNKEGQVVRKQSGAIRPGEVQAEYEPNGAVIMIQWQTLKEHQSFYPPQCHGYILEWPYCLDVDTQEDFDQIAFVLGDRKISDLDLDV